MQNSPADRLLQAVDRDLASEDRRAERIAGIERAFLRSVLQAAKRLERREPDWVDELLTRYGERVGKRQTLANCDIPWSWFAAECQQFPLIVKALDVAWSHEITLRDLLDCFSRLKPVAAFLTWSEEREQLEGCAGGVLLFRETRRLMAVHNWWHPPQSGEVLLAGAVAGQQVILEPASALVAALGCWW